MCAWPSGDVHVCMHSCVCVCVCVCVCAHTRTRARACVRACVCQCPTIKRALSINHSSLFHTSPPLLFSLSLSPDASAHGLSGQAE